MPTARIPIDLTWTGTSGSPGVNVFHARADSIDAVNADFNSLAVILRTFYEGLTEIFCSDFTARWAGEAFGVGDDEGSTYTGTAWSVSGVGGTDHLAPANNVLINWKTPTGGRQGRGRTFIGPLADDCSEPNGTPDEAVRTLVGEAAQDLIDSSSAFGNGALGVYSRVGDTFRDFTSMAVPNFFAVLRSRRD